MVYKHHFLYQANCQTMYFCFFLNKISKYRSYIFPVFLRTRDSIPFCPKIQLLAKAAMFYCKMIMFKAQSDFPLNIMTDNQNVSYISFFPLSI